MRVGIAGANAISGAGDRHRLFASIDSAVRWLEQYPGQHPSVRGVDAEALSLALFS